MDKISVIIPVYNVERYVEKCVRSVMDQTYRNLEIICVNDGSPDGSLAILERLQKEDERIMVLTKENGGLGDARNYGLKYATAEWISFVDSDDYIAKDTYQKLSAAFTHDVDMAYFSFEMVGENVSDELDVEQVAHIQPAGVTDAESVLYSNDFRCAVWAKLFRKSILDKYQIHFEKIYYEDISFSLQYMSVTDKVYNVPERLYYYVLRKGSIMSESAGGTPRAIDHLYGLDAYYDFINRHRPSFIKENVMLMTRLFDLYYRCATQYSTQEKIADVVKKALEIYDTYGFMQDSYDVKEKNRMVCFVRKSGVRCMTLSSLFEKVFSVKREMYAYKYCKVVRLFNMVLYSKIL